jgi:two-component system sensor histidine kinase CpxA
MRGLFAKIFLGFWIAQSLTFLISTVLILRRQFVRPNEVMGVLDSTLPNAATAAANAYEAGGCPGLEQFAASLRQTIYLADTPTHFLCQVSLPPAAANVLARQPTDARAVHSTLIGEQNFWSTAVRSAAGRQYFFLLSRHHTASNYGLRELLFFAFPQLPVAIVVFGITTFILVLLLVRPIGRLRIAARALANGELATRVANPDGEERIFGGDEIQGLVHDFNYMAEQLERLVGAQKILVRDVSHELRSPLARLSVALELAREEAPSSMQEHLQRIDREAGRLNLLIGQLLRLSSIESTNASSHLDKFTLHGLIEELLPDAEYEAQQRGCKIQLLEHSDCTVRANHELIYRAVENIVRNAIRYTRESTVVELKIRCEDMAPLRRVILEVSDSGPGIPESELENVFRPFYRVDVARQQDTGGFGVGLAIADRAVRLHNGELRAQNRPQGGLTISLSLPCEK